MLVVLVPKRFYSPQLLDPTLNWEISFVVPDCGLAELGLELLAIWIENSRIDNRMFWPVKSITVATISSCQAPFSFWARARLCNRFGCGTVLRATGGWPWSWARGLERDFVLHLKEV